MFIMLVNVGERSGEHFGDAAGDFVHNSVQIGTGLFEVCDLFTEVAVPLGERLIFFEC